MESINQATVAALRNYIETHLPGTIHAVDDQKDIEHPLNYPYTSPCSGHKFREFYYWDTYFTCLGLVHMNRWDMILNNIRNCFDLIDKFGYVPNYNRYHGCNRSQPPFLVNLVDMYYRHTGDLDFLREGVAHLEKEMIFWYEQRSFENGLAHYGYQLRPRAESLAFYEMINRTRVPYPLEDEEEKLQAAYQFYAEAESGWDFNPRFGHRALEHAALDLNSNLYAYEAMLSQFHTLLGNPEKVAYWQQRADDRKANMNLHMLDKESRLFLDYDVTNDKLSTCFSLASYFPLYQGLATAEQAEDAVKALPRFLYPYGLSTCEKADRSVIYQWDYPNGWPPLQIVVVRGLLRYGYVQQAHQAAEAFLKNVLKNFEESGHLWEKYNVVEGSLNVSNEYELPVMLGWSAAAALDMMDVLGL